MAPPGYVQAPGYVKLSTPDHLGNPDADADAVALARSAPPGFDTQNSPSNSDSDIAPGFPSDSDIAPGFPDTDSDADADDGTEAERAGAQRGDPEPGFFGQLLEVDKPAGTIASAGSNPSPGEVSVSSTAFVTGPAAAAAAAAAPAAAESEAVEEEIYDAETCEKMSAALGQCPKFAPPLPAWMQPDQ